MMALHARANGMSEGRERRWGKSICDGDEIVVRSNSLQVRMSLARSVMGYAMHPHSLGHGFPPKVRRSVMRRKVVLLMITWVSDFTTALALLCWQR